MYNKDSCSIDQNIGKLLFGFEACLSVNVLKTITLFDNRQTVVLQKISQSDYNYYFTWLVLKYSYYMYVSR